MKLTPGEMESFERIEHSTVCVKDCGLHNKNIVMIYLFACLVGWLNSSTVEKKIKAQSLKTCLGWFEYRHGLMHGLCTLHMNLQGPQSLAHCVYQRLLVQGTFLWFNRVCHGFRQTKLDDYFRVIFDHFWNEIASFLDAPKTVWNWLEPKNQPS